MSNWISIIDSVPKNYENVLYVVAIDGEPKVFIGHRTGVWDEWTDELSREHELYGKETFRHEHVTHWMPLPEPPE